MYNTGRDISYFLDLQEDEGMVIFGYFYNDFFELIDKKDVHIDKIYGFCERNNKKIDYTILVNDYSQYELQVKVMNND